MNRLLNLRPLVRSFRVQKSASCRKYASRAISTTAARNFGATSSVNKRNTPQVDLDILEGLAPAKGVERAAEGSKVNSAAQPAQRAPPKRSKTNFVPKEYFESWASEETDEALKILNMDTYHYISSQLTSPESVQFLSKLDFQTESKFEDLWIAYESADPKDAHPKLTEVLTLLLRHGLQLLPPTTSVPEPAKNIAFVDPTVIEAAMPTSLSNPLEAEVMLNTPSTSEKIQYPNLMQTDELLDPRNVLELPPSEHTPFHNRVVVRNHLSVFHDYPEGMRDDLLEDDAELAPEEEAEEEGEGDLKGVIVPQSYYRNLHQSILMRRSVVQQTGKGKIRRTAFMVLVGDGNGLVGYGEGKHSNGMIALQAARTAAVKNMDWVERFEKRTIWTEMSTKLGATQLILRPRPVGFGLRCNPYLHQILRAAGFKDISAKVWGSRNRLNVIKAAFRLLHAGHAPTGMGDGIGGKGKKLSKGSGLKSKNELERARGRKLISLRK
ncbi:hypothetical protein CVT24_005124 [Panaeolus cyanescens]|uniref:Small ribosomal subunit protein uS5m n=1 Tax=Panaeolus cyanescens TaxID=181874 RepID=A0A409W272_9AGAR|nr:hypothetical protein CVT24_005124 [Panaeolus cyanescens]